MSEPAQGRVEFSRPRSLEGVDVLAVDNCANRWRMFHETFTVCTGLAIGRPAGWRYRARTHSQTADGVMLIEPGEVHSNTEVTAPASFRVLLIRPDVVQAAAHDIGMDAEPHLKVAQLTGGPVHLALVALHAAIEARAEALEVQSRFAECLQMMLAHCAEKPPQQLEGDGRESPAVRRARDYLEAHLADPVSLDALAAAGGGASRFHLLRAFSAKHGVPPHAYQLQLRLARARALLAAGKGASQVAAQLGFADQSHFTRHFRRAIGMTPAAFAAAVRGA